MTRCLSGLERKQSQPRSCHTRIASALVHCRWTMTAPVPSIIPIDLCQNAPVSCAAHHQSPLHRVADTVVATALDVSLTCWLRAHTTPPTLRKWATTGRSGGADFSAIFSATDVLGQNSEWPRQTGSSPQSSLRCMHCHAQHRSCSCPSHSRLLFLQTQSMTSRSVVAWRWASRRPDTRSRSAGNRDAERNVEGNE